MTSGYGLFSIGEACVALPLTEVQEVTPCPDRLAALPTTAPGLLGAVNLRGQVIAVVDLLALNGPPPPREPAGRQVIVVMLHAGKLLGLLVDSVHGVTSPPALQEVGTSSGVGLPVSHTFPAPEGDGIVSVLDAEAVFGLPGIPVVRDDRAGVFGGRSSTAGSGDEAEAGLTETADLAGSMLLVRCAEHRLAVNIEAVHTIVPRVHLRNSPLKHGSCRGVTDFGGAEIPVFDPLAMAGLGELSGQDTEGVAVRFQDGVVVMLLSEILELIPASAGRRFALPEVQVSGRKYLDSVVRVPGRGDFLSLDIAQILGHEDLTALSRLNTPHTGGETDRLPSQRSGEEGEGTAAAGGTYLTFSLGSKDFAVPLEQVIEILPFPGQYSVLEAGNPDVLGLFTHRDTVVPLFRLAGLLGMAGAASPEPPYVLVVSTGADADVVGLAVHSLRAIERSVWEDPAAVPSSERTTLPEALARRRMIRLAAIGTSDEPRMLPRVDLAAIGAALVPPAAIRVATA